MTTTNDPGTAPATKDADTRKIEACTSALVYLGRQIQENPDVCYYIGFGTESFHRIAVALATLTDRSVDEVEAALREDRQPSYRRREPEVVILRKRVDELRELTGQ